MKKLNKFIIIALCALFTSCAAPLLTNSDRGNYKKVVLDNIEDVLEVNVPKMTLPDSPKKEEEKLKTFFDLRDSIPHTFLRVLNSNTNNNDDIIKYIKAPLSDKQPSKPLVISKNIDETSLKVRFLFANVKKYYNNDKLLHPNTRLEFLNTTVELKDPNASIYNIDRLENEFESIDMGTLERTSNIQFSSGLTGDASMKNDNVSSNSSEATDFSNYQPETTTRVFDANGKEVGTIVSKPKESSKTTKSNSSSTTSQGVSGKAELKYASNETIKEALNVKFNRLKTSFSFTPQKLTVSQRGRPLADISDNVFVTATLKIENKGRNLDTKDVSIFSNLFDGNGVLQKAEVIKAEFQNVHYVRCDGVNDLQFSINYEGAIRAVENQKRGRNSLEYDDKVTYYTFKNTNLSSVITIPKSDFCNKVYQIVTTINGEDYILNTDNSNPKEVLFYDEHNPAQFYDWLLKVILKADKDYLKSSTFKLFFKKIKAPQDIVHVMKSSMNDNEVKKLKEITRIEFRIKQ